MEKQKAIPYFQKQSFTSVWGTLCWQSPGLSCLFWGAQLRDYPVLCLADRELKKTIWLRVFLGIRFQRVPSAYNTNHTPTGLMHRSPDRNQLMETPSHAELSKHQSWALSPSSHFSEKESATGVKHRAAAQKTVYFMAEVTASGKSESYKSTKILIQINNQDNWLISKKWKAAQSCIILFRFFGEWKLVRN